MDSIRSLLGKHWYINISLIFVFVFLPVLLFNRDIVFAPHLFTSEWVKTGLTSLILAGVIHLYLEIRRNFNALRESKEFINHYIVAPIDDLLKSIRQYNTLLENNNKEDAKKLSLDLINQIDHCNSSINLIPNKNVEHTAIDTELKIFYHKTSCAVSRDQIEAYLRSYNHSNMLIYSSTYSALKSYYTSYVNEMTRIVESF